MQKKELKFGLTALFLSLSAFADNSADPLMAGFIAQWKSANDISISRIDILPKMKCTEFSRVDETRPLYMKPLFFSVGANHGSVVEIQSADHLPQANWTILKENWSAYVNGSGILYLEERDMPETQAGIYFRETSKGTWIGLFTAKDISGRLHEIDETTHVTECVSRKSK